MGVTNVGVGPLACFGPFWPVLGHFGLFWAILARELVRFGLFWTILRPSAYAHVSYAHVSVILIGFPEWTCTSRNLFGDRVLTMRAALHNICNIL